MCSTASVSTGEIRLAGLLVFIGIIGRTVWLYLRGTLDGATAEAANVANSVARTFSIADAFARGSGPTAHVNPILPAIAGVLYRIFGEGSAAAEIMLTVLALGCAFGAALLFYDAFRRMGVGRAPRLAGLALFCLAPLNISLEVITFRIWEGAMAVLMLAIGLRYIVIIDDRDVVGWKDIAIYSLIAAVGIFINPAVGVALYLIAITFMVRRMSLTRSVAATALATAILLAVLSPWVIRNAIVFRQFIPLRSNFGLEVAIANHPGLQAARDDQDIFFKRFNEIHPMSSPAAIERMKEAGGEKAYADALGAQARKYMLGHPEITVQTTAKHLVEFYFPPVWQFEFGEGRRATVPKALSLWAIAALGIMGALAGAIRYRGKWTYVAVCAFAPAIPYAVVQPNVRYHYLVSTLLMFLAAYFISLVVSAGFAKIRSDEGVIIPADTAPAG